jgi:hypothetical protein
MSRLYTILLLAVICGEGCARAYPERAVHQPASLDSLRAVIQSLVSEPTCDDGAQCRAMAFGAKPCGAPGPIWCTLS